MAQPQPTSMTRAKEWSVEAEEAYRFQTAGYRDEVEYKHLKQNAEVERWPHNGYIKKLQRKGDGYWYYFNKTRELLDKDLQKCKLYVY